MVEEPEDFVVEVNRGAAELNVSETVVLSHVDRLYLLLELLNDFVVVFKELVKLSFSDILLVFELFGK